MTPKHLLAGLATIAVMAFAGSAEAAPVEVTECFSVWTDVDWSQAPAAPVLSAPEVAPGAALSAPATGAPILSQDDLANLAGQGDAPVAVLTEQALTALNTGNTIRATDVGSGAISIGQNAFTGFDGIGNFVINSGHNNNLQSSLSVSIVITQ